MIKYTLGDIPFKGNNLKGLERMNDIEKSEKFDGMKLYTLTEIEPIIGVSHRSLLTYVKQGKIKAVKIGGMWRVKEKDLQDFLNNGNNQ